MTFVQTGRGEAVLIGAYVPREVAADLQEVARELNMAPAQAVNAAISGWVEGARDMLAEATR